MFERIGIITGVDAEAAAFLPGQSSDGEPLHGFLVRQLRHANRDIAITCSGIGKVNAAMAAMMLVEHYQVQLLLVIGTAGKLSDVDGDCFQITEAVQGDYGMFSRVAIEAEARNLAAERDRLQTELTEMQNLTRRLSDDYLDLDLLDQQARDVLGYMRTDEIAIR